jgi:virulence-associated protein VagC
VELPNTLGISYDVWRQLCVWPELVLADIAHKRIPFQFDLSGDLLAWASADHELVIQQFDQEGLGRSVRVSVPESFGVVKEVLLSQEGDALAVSSVDGPWKVYRLDFPKIHEEAGARILLNAEVVARDLAGAMEP